MREILEEALEGQKAHRGLLDMQFSRKNKLPKPRGKTLYKDSEKGRNILPKSFVGCPSRKNLILKCEDFILE